MRNQLIAFVLFLTLVSAISANGQGQSNRPPFPPTTPAGEDANEARDRVEREMAKKTNQARQAGLKSDTDKLVKLSGELKEYVDKSNENLLSLDVLKKAEEIEKLARSVKEKMKGAR